MGQLDHTHRSATAVRLALEKSVGGEVRFDRISRAIYSTDASVYQIFPLGVVIPRSAQDVITTVGICRQHGVSITARGGGTSQSGQAVGAGVQIDLSKYMRRVLEFDPVARTVLVEPGIVIDELNHRIRASGLWLPIDLSTASRATIGGMIANNSSGTRSIIYGSTIDYVLELEVVLADGSVVTMKPLGGEELEGKCRQDDLEGASYRVVRRLAEEHAAEIEARYPKILRRVGGYNLDRFTPSCGSFDLCKLIVGSEGTLALVLSAKLRLVERLGQTVLAVLQFEDLRQAMKATPLILVHRPSALELMDRNLLEMTRGKTEFEPLRDFIVGDPGAILIVEFSGDSQQALLERVDLLESDLRSRNLTKEVHRAPDAKAQSRVWRLRQAGLGLSMAETGDTKGVSHVEDTAVAPDRLPEYIDRFRAILAENDTDASFYAHASVGLLHVRPAINMKTVGGVEKFRRITEQVSDLVLEFGGALSAEHGDGLVRSPFQRKMFGPVIYDAFREIKRTFDETGLFNPGKIVDAAPMTDNLRYGPTYSTNEIATVFDFSDFGGISRAAEQCGGVGACRKALTGTMCPSYMATLDESDTTRARANALRLAISGQLGPLGLSDPELRRVLDLCLECKACKSECPTGVDMARLKSEFLHRCHAEHGASWRAGLFASIAGIAVWGSRLAPVSNWMIGNRATRRLSELLLQVDRQRRPPPFSRHTFERWWKRRQVGHNSESGDRSRVAVFVDTFTNFYEPRHGVAAVSLAEKLGIEVIVPPRVCCGRPLISEGFLDRAREQAAATARVLFPLAQSSVPIVFCEPGCYSAVRDDHPLLLRGELQEQAESVSRACVTFEEWAEAALAARDYTVRVTSGPDRILLHGHCHQRALVGADPTIKLLSRIPNCAVIDADSGCCGMGGSFGYELEHYSVSQAVGERRLFPAIRERAPDSVVVAPGFSCRQQIRHFTGVEALSVIEVVALAIEGPQPRP